MAATAAILKFFKRHLLLNPKSDWAKTWWEASQWHRDSKLLKSFRSDVQDGRHGGHPEILQTTSPLKPYVRLSWNLMGGITVTQRFKIAKSFHSDIQETWWEASQWFRFKIAKIVPFRYPSWNLSNISSQTLSPIVLKLDGWHHSDTEIQNC